MAEADMGTSSSKHNKKLHNINENVNSLQSSIRRSNRRFTEETKNKLVDNLVKWSQEASSLQDKVDKKHLDHVQGNISHTMEDVLSRTSQEHDQLDMGAVETSSFVQLPLNKRQNSNKDLTNLPAKKQKSSQVDFVKASGSTLSDIEEKFRSLKPLMKVAIEQRDLTQLRIHQQTIKVLVTDLEMIEVREHTPLGDRKNKLDKSIMSQYNKIVKTVKDIKRERDINYLKKQNKRALNELEEIQKELSEIDSLLPVLLKNNDQSTMNGLHENLLIIRQRLSSLETIDETTKQLQLQQQKKLADISKVLDDITKGSSQSDLTKAKVNYEEIIRNIASGNSLDKDEIKVKLQSLQNFINSINEENENIQKGKQQLLNNVRQSFSFILDKEQKIQNTHVDSDNKKSNDDVKELDDFYNNWKSLQKAINPSTLDDYSKIDKVLSDIQKSIEETRQQIAEHNSLPSNLKKKLNHSTPNLSSPKVLDSKFGSTLSVDHTDQSLIKTRAKVYTLSTPHIQNINDQAVVTRAKVYNLSTPQIQTINDQAVVLRNKQFYNNNSNPNDNRPFSKIEEIKTQVNYIKEKFNESHQKQHLKNKLESYVEIINGYIHHQNQRIANSAKTLLADIQEMLKSISHIPEAMNVTQRRASIELSFENIVSIQGSVEKLEKDVISFEGKKDDPVYKKITEDLSECKGYLQSIEIPPKYDMIQQQKEEVLNKIEVTFNLLFSKCFSNVVEDAEITDTKNKLNSLKKKVNRFSGAYKGVLYNQIEKDLNKLLVDIPETIGDRIISEDITKDAEKHLQILEHRATKDQSFRRVLSDTKSRNEDEEKLIKLKGDLLDIKKSIDTTPTNAVNLFLHLKSRLDLVKLGLDQLKFTLEEDEKQKDILYNEVETLKNVVEAKISLAKQSVKQWPLEQDKEKLNLEELKRVEEKFKSLKPEIESFIGTTSDNKFYELDENSIRLILKMDKLQFERNSEAHNKKIDLLKEIYHYGDLLDQRAKESEDLLDVERTLQDIENNFARNLKLNDFESTQEKLVALKTQINKSQYNDYLLPRKQVCIQGIETLFGKIEQSKASTDSKIVKVNIGNDPDHMISNIELQFSNIKKEIDNFSGTHSDNKYYEINSSLTALFLKLDNLQLSEASELRPRKIVLLKEMHMYTEILYKRAKECEDLQEVNKHLSKINKMVDSYKGKDEELKTMENELKSVQRRLDNIKIGENERKSVDNKLGILVSEYNRLKKAKETPANYLGSSSFHSDVQNNVNKIQQNLKTTNDRLAEIAKDIDFVRNAATSFMKSDTSQEYKTLEDTLLRLKMRLSKLETERNSEVIRRRNELEKRIEECLNILDERSMDVVSIVEFEDALDKINDMLKNAIGETEKSAIDEKLIHLQVKLGKLRVNEDLIQRKIMCGSRIISYQKLLKGNTDIQNKTISS